MRVGLKITLKDVDPEVWANNNNGPWPEHDKNALNTAVRQDIKSYIQNCISQCALIEELDIEVEVR